MALFIFGWAAIIAALGVLADIAWSRDADDAPSALVLGFISFILSIIMNAMMLKFVNPVFAGWQILLMGFIMVIPTTLVFGVGTLLLERTTVGSWAVPIAFALFAVGAGITNAVALEQSGANAYLSHIHVIDETKNGFTNYVNSSTQHMVLVSEPVAQGSVKQALNTPVSTEAGAPNLGSIYDLGDGALQAINGHMYWVFELRLTTNKYNNQSKWVNSTVHGYFTVDAEDPILRAQYVTTYTDGHTQDATGKLKQFPINIKYMPAQGDASIDRLVYRYDHTHIVDGLTLEVDDNGRPYYTGTLNSPIERWGQSAPQTFILVDPQSGQITPYALGSVPPWVDRVYSASTAEQLMNYYGQWGRSSYSSKGSADKYHVDGTPTLVYTTTDTPAWQMLLTSEVENDTSIAYVAMMDTRTGVVRLFTAPPGTVTMGSVTSTFVKGQKGSAGQALEAESPALHRINGVFTWVASMAVSQTSGSDSSSSATQTFNGIGLLPLIGGLMSQDNVVVAKNLNDALSAMNQRIALGDQNTQTPGSSSVRNSVNGSVTFVGLPTNVGNSTVFLVTVDSDPSHTYDFTLTASTMNVTLIQKGDKVVITYNDSGNQIRYITSIDDVTHPLFSSTSTVQ